jgi:hypothetical protein
MHSLKNWWFSLVLAVVYLGMFILWTASARNIIVFTACASTLALLIALAWAAKRRYFFNFWDGLLHAIVILDLLLEGTLIRDHSSRGFYLCALAFAAVIAGYRLHLRRKHFA